MDFLGIRGLRQRLADAGVGHQAGDAGQQVQMGLGGGFRDQQKEQQAGVRPSLASNRTGSASRMKAA
jgi:hypothetical protein